MLPGAVWPAVGESRGVFWKLSTVLDTVKSWLDKQLRGTDSRMFLGADRYRDVLVLYQALLEEILPAGWSRAPGSDFDTAYCSFFHPNVHATLRDGQIWLVLERDVWDLYEADWINFEQSFDFHGSTSEEAPPWWVEGKDPSNLRVCMELDLVREYMRRSRGFELTYLLRQASIRTGIDDWELLETDMANLNDQILVPIGPWSQVLVDDFCCDGVLEKIHII